MRRTAEERYLSYLAPPDENGCVLWTGGIHKDGYGIFQFEGKPWGAHRWAYQHFKGPIAPGLEVCHTCDTPPCQALDHLWLGTHRENIADRVQKGRSVAARGEAMWRTRFSEEDVREIRRVYAQGGISMKELGALHGVTYGAIFGIISRKTWKHVE